MNSIDQLRAHWRMASLMSALPSKTTRTSAGDAEDSLQADAKQSETTTEPIHTHVYG